MISFAAMSHQSQKNAKRKRGRACQIEELESRDMLSVDLFNAVNTFYANLELGNYENYHIIEIAANQLDDINYVKEKFNEANATTDKTSLIVAHTTQSQNKIEVSGGTIEVGNAAGVVFVSYGDASLTIDGSKNAGERIFLTTEVVTFAGLTIVNGTTSTHGGAIRNNEGTLTITDCTLDNNSAVYNGGAIFNFNGTLTLTHSVVSNSTAWSGGGIYIQGEESSLIVSNSTIKENVATQSGGGIDGSYTGIIRIYNSEIIGNEAGYGGGVYGEMIVVDSLISGNTARGNSSAYVSGGGLYTRGESRLENCIIIDNRAYTTHYYSNIQGGGIYNHNGTLTILNCEIVENYAESAYVDQPRGNTITATGGGIYSNGNLTVRESTIAENWAVCFTTDDSSFSAGGGIFSVPHSLASPSNLLILENCKIVGNDASRSGGIHTERANIVNCLIAGNVADPDQTAGISIAVSVSGPTPESLAILTNNTIAGNYGVGVHLSGTDWIEVNNTIIAHNVDSQQQNADLIIYGAKVLGQNSLIGNGGVQDQLQNGEWGNIVGTADVPIDPMFAALDMTQPWTKDLWRSWDFNLAAESPAIDAGSDRFAVSSHQMPLQIDHDGKARIFGDAVDIGAYEYVALPTEEEENEEEQGEEEENEEEQGEEEENEEEQGEEEENEEEQGEEEENEEEQGEEEENEEEQGEEEENEEEQGEEEENEEEQGEEEENEEQQGEEEENEEEQGEEEESEEQQEDEEEEKNDDDEIPLLATPSGVKAITATISSLYITWNKVDHAIGYKIEYAVGSIAGEDFTAGTMAFISENESTITYRLVGLAFPGTTYHVRVIALSDKTNFGDSEYSQIMSADTAFLYSQAIAAVKPRARLVRSIDISTITLTWPIHGSNAVYQIDCDKLQPHEFKVNYHFANGVITGATISGLSPNTAYRFTITAINLQDNARNAKGKKDAAVVVKAKTPKLIIPNGIKADKKQTGLDCITLFWRPPASETNGYTIVVRSKNVADTTIHIESGVVMSSGNLNVTLPSLVNGRCEMTVSGLQASTKYTFLMQGFADGITDERVWSKMVRVNASTLRYPAPVKVVVAERTADSVTLSWSLPKYPKNFGRDPATHYEVYMVDQNKTETSLGFTEGTGTLTLTVPCNSGKHTLFVRAVVRDVHGQVINKSLSAKITLSR
ncbi:MAG: hypothetical protein FWG73_09260 [Planctomycetaceae bacterium]|nr:hypothetical protein [Planctomycetaceae bacterium]